MLVMGFGGAGADQAKTGVPFAPRGPRATVLPQTNAYFVVESAHTAQTVPTFPRLHPQTRTVIIRSNGLCRHPTLEIRIFWAGPLLGGALGAVVWEAVLRPDQPI